MSETKQMMIWSIQDLKNIEKLFKGNEEVIKEQRELTEFVINQYLKEENKS